VRLCSDACISHPELFGNSGQSGGAVSVILERASSLLVKVDGTAVPSVCYSRLCIIVVGESR
jgi:hypothetical protein